MENLIISSFRGIEAPGFDVVYHRILRKLYKNPDFIGEARGVGFREVLGLAFTLTNPGQNKVMSKTRAVNYEYAQAFFEWILSGSPDPDELIKINPRVAAFVDTTGLPESFSTAYPPRIMRQLPRVIKLLQEDRETRRAVIHILEEGDKLLWDHETTMEYPCTNSIQLFIRHGLLFMMVNMRSNDAALTLCYDVFNFTSLQIHLAQVLGIGVGDYYHQSNSMHYFTRNDDIVRKILIERFGEAEVLANITKTTI